MKLLWRSLKRLLSQPDFVIVFALLAISALSLNFATDYLKLHFRKRPVALRVSDWGAPDGIPATLGHWVQISHDKPLDPDTEHILATRQYVYRDYINADAVGAQQVEELRQMPPEQRGSAVAELESRRPEAVMHVGITYYTGMVDTVAHIPDRCYIGDGFDVTTYQIEQDQHLGDYADGTPRNVTFRFINFNDQTGRGRLAKNVAYLFHVNGHYDDSPLGVRRSLQNLFEPYGYYAKVELMTSNPSAMAFGDAQKAIQEKALTAMEDFFSSLLPQIERCLPDWQKLHARPLK